jgi:hypothetical protein
MKENRPPFLQVLRSLYRLAINWQRLSSGNHLATTCMLPVGCQTVQGILLIERCHRDDIQHQRTIWCFSWSMMCQSLASGKEKKGGAKETQNRQECLLSRKSLE